MADGPSLFDRFPANGCCPGRSAGSAADQIPRRDRLTAYHKDRCPVCRQPRRVRLRRTREQGSLTIGWMRVNARVAGKVCMECGGPADRGLSQLDLSPVCGLVRGRNAANAVVCPVAR
jgi:hypothetical protein